MSRSGGAQLIGTGIWEAVRLQLMNPLMRTKANAQPPIRPLSHKQVLTKLVV